MMMTNQIGNRWAIRNTLKLIKMMAFILVHSSNCGRLKMIKEILITLPIPTFGAAIAMFVLLFVDLSFGG